MALDLKKDPSQYHYLSMGGEACRCTSDDKKLYEEVQRAMGVSIVNEGLRSEGEPRRYNVEGRREMEREKEILPI